MESKSHFLVHFIPGMLPGSVVGLAFGSLLVASQIPRTAITTVSSSTSAPRSVSIGDLSLQYPAGWHVQTTSIFDNPNRILPGYTAFISPEPIYFTSPSEGTGTPITVHFADEGEAILAPYESNQYKEYLTDEIVINGKKVTRLRLTASDDAVLMPRYQEVLFVGGYVVQYDYKNQSEANDPNWLLIKNSLKVSGTQATNVPYGTVIEKSCFTGGDHEECLTLKQGGILPVGTGWVTGQYLGVQSMVNGYTNEPISCPVFEIEGGSKMILDAFKRLASDGSGIAPLVNGKIHWILGQKLPIGDRLDFPNAVRIGVEVPPIGEGDMPPCFSPMRALWTTEEI